MKTSSKLNALMAAALALPGLAPAQTAPNKATVRMQYSDYEDWQQGGEDRIRVKTPSFLINAPLSKTLEMDAGLVLDSISGASPLYHSTLSGASGKGIRDYRKAGDLKLTKHFERVSIGLGGTFSFEDDYDSRGGLVEARVYSADRATELTIGITATEDEITSSQTDLLNEERSVQSYFAGLTQTLDRYTRIQSNLSVTTGDGYFSDPYKAFDLRPTSRDQYAWLNRYMRYLEPGSSLHLDYRYYKDSWELSSHTIEAAWYKELPRGFLIRPNIRYYTQRNAEFYSGIYPPENLEGHYSADQRLATFGGVTLGLKVIKDLGNDLSIDAAFEYLTQRDTLALGGGGSSEIEPFYARFLTVGLTKKF